MPPRVQNVNAAGTGVNSWYSNLPPLTRFYATALLATTTAVRFGFLGPFWIALIWPNVYQKFEVWRLVTNFFFMGGFSFRWLFKMIWLVTYGTTLESQTYQFEPSEFALLLLFGMGAQLLLSVPFLMLGIPMYFQADTIIFMLLYVWSRQFPEVQVSIYGIFKVLSFYVPFIFIFIEFILTDAIPWGDICGIVIGHMHYYLTVLYPAIGGPQLLKPPLFLKNFLADRGIGQRLNLHAASGQATFQAFRGRAARLGTQ